GATLRASSPRPSRSLRSCRRTWRLRDEAKALRHELQQALCHAVLREKRGFRAVSCTAAVQQCTAAMRRTHICLNKCVYESLTESVSERFLSLSAMWPRMSRVT